jgi:hypothetical protein
MTALRAQNMIMKERKGIRSRIRIRSRSKSRNRNKSKREINQMMKGRLSMSVVRTNRKMLKTKAMTS